MVVLGIHLAIEQGGNNDLVTGKINVEGTITDGFPLIKPVMPPVFVIALDNPQTKALGIGGVSGGDRLAGAGGNQLLELLFLGGG